MVDTPRDFAGKDLRNRSFRGQDLRGADFSGSNLRGCDFREANLVGASFERAEMGQSRRQLIFLAIIVVAIVLTGAGLGAIAVAVIGAVASVGTEAVAVAVAVAGATAVAGIRAVSGVGAGVGVGAGIVAVAVAVAVASRATAAFSSGVIEKGILYSLITLILVSFAAYSLWGMMKAVRNAYGTNFQEADLTNTIFRGAKIYNATFTNAKKHWTDWEGAKTAYLYFEITPVFQLEVDRTSGRNGNYVEANFENLWLSDAMLRGANLNAANLSGAKFQRADFRDANLTNAKAVGTDFTGSDFTGAIIQNWGITNETIFDGVYCDYVYLSEDKNPQSRKPLSDQFSPGDFAKLVRSFTETLDFLLHAHDDPQAFVRAMQEMMETYGPQNMQPAGFAHLGDGDRLFKFEVSPDLDKTKIHAETTGRISEFQLEAAIQAERVNQLEAQKADQREYINFLQDFMKEGLPNLLTQGGCQNIYMNSVGDLKMDNQTFTNSGSGDMSGIAGRDLSGVAGKDIQGAAGRDLSGQVMLSIESLRQSDIPEAPTLANLLSQLKDHIDSSDLPAETKTAAQSHIEQLTKAPTMPTPEGIKEAADKSIGFFKAISQILPSLSSAINGLLGQITALLG